MRGDGTAGAVSGPTVTVQGSALGDGVVVFFLVEGGIGLLEKEGALKDGEENAYCGDEVGQEVGVSSEEAVLGEEVRVEDGGFGQEAAHGRADDASEGPYEGLTCICSC